MAMYSPIVSLTDIWVHLFWAKDIAVCMLILKSGEKLKSNFFRPNDDLFCEVWFHDFSYVQSVLHISSVVEQLQNFKKGIESFAMLFLQI